jgi:outer membrane autotransporter protein
VTAEGGVGSTRFAALTQPGGLADGTRLRAFYSANAIDLNVVPTAYLAFGQARGSNRNALSVAAGLDAIVAVQDQATATADQNNLINAVSGMGEPALLTTMRTLSGEVHGVLAAALPVSGQRLQDAVSKHLLTPTSESLGAWVDYAVGSTRWQSDDTASSAQATRRQFTFGVDLLNTDGWRMGVAGSQSTQNVDTDGSGSGELKDALGVVYGQYTLGAWKADAQVGAGSGKATSLRNDPLMAYGYSAGALSTDLTTEQQFASLGVRKTLELSGVNLEPFARVSVQKTHRAAGTEGSATPSALSLNELNVYGSRTEAGVSLASEGKNPAVVQTTFGGRLAVGHDGGDLFNPVVGATLAGTPISISAPKLGRNYVRADLSGTWLLTPGAYVYAGLAGEARKLRVEKSASLGAVVLF